MSYFSQPKPDKKATAAPAPARPASTSGDGSILGPGMAIEGNIVSTGPVQIYGQVTGDIYAAQLTICEGAQVDGKVVAQESVISGAFRGTIHSNTVRLTGTAMVDGEIHNKSLTIDENAQFEGVSRRLDKVIEAPSSLQFTAGSADDTHSTSLSADVVPMTKTY